ncbi:MAG: phenylacetate-CoA oxygenase subunit PaaC [Cyclobacteriaceae bacterium]|nr:phenylacetate-CoA oxygenase subunit PaaC [Cyclobacteriaceae bacterium]
MNTPAIKELLYKIGDDQLILGHRNSEWTGLGPILEEDIAFCSMAQDKIGQSLAIFSILHELGEPDPDTNAFLRDAKLFKNCQYVEMPIGEFDFSIVRHFLFDNAEAIRFKHLTDSSFIPLANLSKKIKGELKYHTMHANTWIKRLGNGSKESIDRVQKALNDSWTMALGMFEVSPYEAELIQEKIFVGEKVIMQEWYESISATIEGTELSLPDLYSSKPMLGGRQGLHTESLIKLLDEMSEVIRLDPEAEW